MASPSPASDRLLALSGLGVILFLSPLLAVFDAGPDAEVFGIPLLFVYLFTAWLVLIVLVAVAVEGGGPVGPSAGKGERE